MAWVNKCMWIAKSKWIDREKGIQVKTLAALLCVNCKCAHFVPHHVVIYAAFCRCVLFVFLCVSFWLMIARVHYFWNFLPYIYCIWCSSLLAFAFSMFTSLSLLLLLLASLPSPSIHLFVYLLILICVVIVKSSKIML